MEDWLMRPPGNLVQRGGRSGRRRGVILVESAIIYGVTLMLLLGTIVMGMGVFRYGQVAALAREGSRWASVHGPKFVSEQAGTAITGGDVFNAIKPRMVAMDATAFTYTLTMASGKAIFTLNYRWTPEAYFAPLTLSSTSTTPILY